jgi:predicted metal-dependent hydrolase
VRRRVTLKGRRQQYLLHKERARTIANERARHYAHIYGVSVRKIFIKNAKTRWGSCSKNGNLNFHYKIALLPPYLANYLVVHEVCHLREFNHSKKFWALVAQEVPDYRALRLRLKKM